MSQMELFCDVAESAPMSPMPGATRELWYDADNWTIAGYDCHVAQPLWVFAGVTARLTRYHGDSARTWATRVRLDLPTDNRLAWEVERRFATQDEAAQEIADAIACAERIFFRALQGEEMVTPGLRMWLAAHEAADSDPECVAAAEEERRARSAVSCAGDNSDAWFALRSNYIAAKRAAHEVRARFVREFQNSHDWREFA